MQGTVAGFPAIVLLDCGATHSFVSSLWVNRYSVCTVGAEQPLNVMMADGRTSIKCDQRTASLAVKIRDCSFSHEFTVLDLNGVDAVLGMPWFYDYSPVIDYTQRKVETTVGSFAVPAINSSGGSPDPRVPNADFNFISARRAAKYLRSGSLGFIAWVETMDPEQARSKPTSLSVKATFPREHFDKDGGAARVGPTHVLLIRCSFLCVFM